MSKCERKVPLYKNVETLSTFWTIKDFVCKYSCELDGPHIYSSVHASEWDFRFKEYSGISLDPPAWAVV